MKDLRAMWDYDIWANERWLEILVHFPDPQRADEVMTHIHWAQWTWLRRVDGALNLGLVLPDEPKAPSIVLARELARQWRDVLDNSDKETMVAYQNMAGESFTSRLGDIVRHVVTHGAYHRGQLRGMAGEQGMVDFPETDYIIWAREHSGA